MLPSYHPYQVLGHLSEAEDFSRLVLTGGKQLAVCATLARLLESRGVRAHIYAYMEACTCAHAHAHAQVLSAAASRSATRTIKNAALDPAMCAQPQTLTPTLPPTPTLALALALALPLTLTPTLTLTLTLTLALALALAPTRSACAMVVCSSIAARSTPPSQP